MTAAPSDGAPAAHGPRGRYGKMCAFVRLRGGGKPGAADGGSTRL
jgi:hypothetical protein